MIQMKLLSRETMAERGGGDKLEQLFLTLSILIAVEDAKFDNYQFLFFFKSLESFQKYWSKVEFDGSK